MIHNIIHISDIHIRTGDTTKSRYDEYINVFDNLYDSISQQPSILNKSAVIVITGDIFHDKNKIGPAGIKIATYLLHKLSSLATVLIIRGNHDYRQDFPTEHDMISALISYNIPNIIYLDKSGLHNYKNISFGLVAIQETLLFGSTSGIKGDLPDFPFPENDNAQYNIALFHGTIVGTTLQNGSKSMLDGYPIEWFKGYDAILLGDVHLQQINRASIIENIPCSLPHTTLCQTYTYNEHVPWGYSGSLIQQDFGETIKGHGYVLWNLKDKLISVYHIKNQAGMVKLYWNGDIDNIHVEHKQYIKPITKTAPLHKIILSKWFPDRLHIRVSGENVTSDIMRLITQKIMSYGKNVLSISNKSFSKSVLFNETDDDNDIANTILDINSSDTLVQYIENLTITENKTLKSNKWKQWLSHPETIRISTDNIPEKVVSKLSSKINNLDKSITTFTDEFDKVKTQQINTSNLILHKLEWNWVLNYKNGNVFDFDKNTKNISILNAKNGNGKSNFLEIICIALFGEGFPSRHNKNYTANIICDKKPDGVMASTSISFTLNNNIFVLERVMRNQGVKRSIQFENVILYRIIDDKKEILHQKSNAVDTWVEHNIGKCDTYLMSAMLSQNADNDFFSLDNLAQKKLLDRVLSLEHINSLQKLLKDSVSYYKTCTDLIESYYDGVKSNKHVVDQKYIDELSKLQSNLEIISQTKQELYPKWHMVSDKSLSEITNINDLELNILKLQRHIQSLPLQEQDDIKKQIIELNASIQRFTAEVSLFHSFSDLGFSEDVDDDEDNKSYHLQSLKNDISRLELYLRLHPYYKRKDFDIYTDIDTLVDNIDSEFENDDDIDNLVKSIHEFENWNSIQNQKFDQDRIYFENNSEIEKLECQVNSFIPIIQDYPEKISKLAKQHDKLRKQYNKLTKEKDLCSDKRPNRPTKTKEWLEQHELNISQYDTLENLGLIKQFIEKSIQHIPIICTKIHNISQKISEGEQYIKECNDFPFNPDCDACYKQPWRTKYDSIIKDLPSLKNDVLILKQELIPLKCDSIKTELDINSYLPYLTALNKELNIICNNITDLELYRNEKQLWNLWDKWSNEYDRIKQECDTLFLELNNLDTQKKKLETILERTRFDKHTLQTKLENIQNKRLEYTNYISELNARTSNYEIAKNRLNWLWYSTLYDYRLCISNYLSLITIEIEQMEEKKKELEEILNMILERQTTEKLLNEQLVIYTAYPHWIQWNKLHSDEKDINLQVNELQVIIKGATYGSNNEEMLKCLELLKNIKDDYDDLVYILSAFDGYREWLYKENIAPTIQNRVNGILELICEERPLYLECEWLDAIDTLSWFIRDGTSKVIIQKASGFQRFIVGIAMRVAINQIGLSRVRFNELFIDEGFTACDSDNLERVPEFLKGLLQFYNSIYLATHLEDLKACADKHIYIKRDDDGLSLIQHGCATVLKEAQEKVLASTTLKKRGRPTKNNILVVRA
jgi:DNA repair exonuclease SbcCD ATPase subunit/DNA repair exonuclease SbcCD nuclease subunit